MPPRQRTPEGPAPDPAVQRLRVQYAKRGRLRFTSSRDFQRAIERAVRRTGMPVAFSAGFHPHPKISYANAAPTGVASEAEYFEIAVTRVLEPEQVRAALDEALPSGLDVVTVVESSGGSLADRLEASLWQLRFEGLGPAVLQEAVVELLAREEVQVSRMMKSGLRTFDVRSALVSAEVLASGPDDDADCGILRVVVRHATPAVRPDDILAAMRSVTDLEPPRSPLVTRLAQGPLDAATGTVTDPLSTDSMDDVGTRPGAALPREPDEV